MPMPLKTTVLRNESWAFALLAICLLVVGGRMTAAGIASYRANAFIGAWSAAGTMPEPQAWEVAADAAQQAVAWYPVANGEYLDRLGQVYSWRHFQLPYGDPVAEESRRAALASYRKAVAARPTAPGAWARLAHAKLALLELDPEFRRAFAAAGKFGPGRRDIHRELAEIGLIAWSALDAAERRQTVEHVHQTARLSTDGGREMAGLLERTGMVTIVCADLQRKGDREATLCP